MENADSLLPVADGYAPDVAERLIPLVRSIAVELSERRARARRLESRLRVLFDRPASDPELGGVTAELADHRREIRRALSELKRLGCSVESQRPIRVRIPGDGGSDWLFALGDPVGTPLSTA